ncbi:hypothetical protein BDZ89DRAFT_1130011 [Hymenopellis radicata]|nr:hypothetical protein BDZ89DRAFT_1130011 [Hymenopellis radicata]
MPPARTSAVKSGPNPTRSSPRKAAACKVNDVRTSSSTSTPTFPAEVSASAPSRVIRPPQGWIPSRTCNPFFMFRSWRSQQDRANGKKVGQQQIMSKSYSDEWAELSDAEKKPYFSAGREINKTLQRVKVAWSPHTDHMFVIDGEGAIVYDTPLTKPSAKVHVPTPWHVSLAAPPTVTEEDVAMENAFPPSPSSFEELDTEMDYLDVGRLAPKTIVQSHAMDYEERSPTYEPFYVTPTTDYDPTQWANFHASREEKVPNELDYPDCSDFDDLNLAIYTDEDQENYYNSYVAWD